MAIHFNRTSFKYNLTFVGEVEPDLGAKIDEVTVLDNDMLQVYPNPADNTIRVMVDAASVGDLTVSLMSITGVQIYREEVAGNVSDIDVSKLKSGSYIVKVTSEGVSLNQLVLIRH